MDSRRTFGRRATAQAVPQRSVLPPPVPKLTMPAPEPSFPPLSSEPKLASIEDEVEAWKAARGPVVSFPWRQCSLMAGLCFGIASFVLPNTVNDAVQWPLYLLAAISFYAGLHKRKAEAP